MNFRVLPIPQNISDQTRASLKSPQYGHPAHAEVASGTGPCRCCLRLFRVGLDRRILFTYDPFAGIDPYPSPGPIFIHEEECSPFDSGAGFPAELRTLPLTLEAYARGRWLVARERPGKQDIENAIVRLFSNPIVEYIHVRNTEAGCFMAQIVRDNGVAGEEQQRRGHVSRF